MPKIASHRLPVIAKTLDAAFRSATIAVRDAMGDADIGAFTLVVKASGRTMTDRGDVKIEYRIGDNDWSGGGVEGDTLDAVLVEQLRRHGWSLEHKPLTLPSPVEVDDDVS